MPVVVPSSNVSIAGQVNLSSQPPSTQLTFRQMVGEVLQWNPEAPPLMAQRWLQNAYRKVVDRRNWYGLMIRGQVTVPTVYTTGTVAFTLGSPIVTGLGTTWTSDMVGRQIRAGFSTGWYNISSFQSPTQLTLDLPWGNPSLTNTGYQIVQTWVSLGPNIKNVLDMVNQRQGWRIGCNIPQQAINQWDTWRTTTGWTQILANKEPTAAGWPQYELWPAPTFQQVFPFLAYVQPPDLQQDGDYPATCIRSDVIVSGALKDALTFRGKASAYYDPQLAQAKEREFKEEIEKMVNVDQGLWTTELQWDYSRWPMSQAGSLFMQSHAEGPW